MLGVEVANDGSGGQESVELREVADRHASVLAHPLHDPDQKLPHSAKGVAILGPRKLCTLPTGALEEGGQPRVIADPIFALTFAQVIAPFGIDEIGP